MSIQIVKILKRLAVRTKKTGSNEGVLNTSPNARPISKIGRNTTRGAMRVLGT